MNITVETCPQGHGLLLKGSHMVHLVGPTAMIRIGELIRAGRPEIPTCPSADGALRSFEFDQVPALGCGACGSVWFDTGVLQRHVQEVRGRTFGRSAFAAQQAPSEDPVAFFPAEVVAGLFADFELTLEPDA